jgi:hypothetical protein
MDRRRRDGLQLLAIGEAGMRKRDLLSAAAGAAVASVLAGGIAWAAIPGAGGVINGCHQKNEGMLRVIDSAAAEQCRSSDVPISWSARGIDGAKGGPGAPGRDGVDGRDGAGVSVAPEAPGANCALGGVKIVAANGVGYVCSGPPPDPGEDQ